MTSAVEIHLYSFLLMVWGGVALSALFDLERFLRRKAGARAWLKDLLDLAYWCLSIPLLALFFFMASWGQLRLYLFLGLALGGIAYFWLASPYVLSLCAWLDRWLRRVARWLIQPVKLVFRLTTSILRWFSKPFWRMTLWLYRKLPVRFRRRVFTVRQRLCSWWKRLKRLV